MAKSNIVYFLLGLTVASTMSCSDTQQKIADEAANCPQLASELSNLQAQAEMLKQYVPAETPITTQIENQCSTIVAETQRSRNTGRGLGMYCVMSKLSSCIFHERNDPTPDCKATGDTSPTDSLVKISDVRDALRECGMGFLVVDD